MKTFVLVLAFAVVALGQESSFDSAGIRLALKIYDDCSKSNGFSSCLKKKAITFLDRLGRMDHFTLGEGVMVIRSNEVALEPTLSEEQLEKTLPRAADAKDDALTTILMDKLTKFVSSRTLEVSIPKMGLEEGRGKKMKMMGGMMMGMVAKMAAMIPVAIAGLFLLAGKALITAKIALLISGIIAIKKLFASKQGGGGHGGGGGGGGHGWQSGGWQSGGGGWDKRSFDDAQKLAYKAYSPK